jgi:hypothetical protein
MMSVENGSDLNVKNAVASLGTPEKNGPGMPSKNVKYPTPSPVPSALIASLSRPCDAMCPAGTSANVGPRTKKLSGQIIGKTW